MILVLDLSVSDTLNMTGAIVSGIPVDNTTIAFTNHELTLIDGSIDTNHIKDRAVTEIKIALGAVGTHELGNLTSLTFEQTGASTTITITNITVAANITISIPDPGVNSDFVLTDGAQTINGVKTFSTPISIASGRTNSGKALNNEQVMILLSGEIIGGRTIGNGQIMIGSSILQPIPVNITLTGGSLSITNGHNSINLETSSAGSFSDITLTASSNQIILKPNSGTLITLNANNPAASLVYNFPNVSANANIVITCEAIES